MNKKGFTIAEALITLAIIGTVATLVLPTFVSSYRKQIYGNSLAAAASQFESAMANLMMRDSVTDLLDTNAWLSIRNNNTLQYRLNSASNNINDFLQEISPCLYIRNFEVDPIEYTLLDNQGNYGNNNLDQSVRFLTKSGPEYKIFIDNTSKANARTEAAAIAARTNYTNKAADVFIDINGTEEPNILGRDLFIYELGTDGRLYPFGGDDQSFYNNNNRRTAEEIREACVENRNGELCAAYLANNRYDMDY